ncbi:MAG: polyprenyl synthetase family protein [Duodenibacillus sp.]|nr:polyprenyl synthetase family protein [Duodenibacillus sp.]
MTTGFEDWSAARRARVEAALEAALPPVDGPLSRLAEAMRYAVLGGGKRVRALLAFAAGELTGASDEALAGVGAALEMIHGYSLVHDDLPCMDNDLLRRGKPTCHVRFGEAGAMLAGDALTPAAMALLARLPLPAGRRIALVEELSEASGLTGMCGGQAVDLESTGRFATREELSAMHSMKTGALILAAVRMGAMAGDEALCRAAEAPLSAYARSVGLAFQVIDDILDATASAEDLGKTPGKDARDNKATYVTLLGLDAARAMAADLHARALLALDAAEAAAGAGKADRLRQLAAYLAGRRC